jgi:hypothetical protein
MTKLLYQDVISMGELVFIGLLASRVREDSGKSSEEQPNGQKARNI